MGEQFKPAGPAKRILARISHRVLKWTTTCRKTKGEKYEGGAFDNPILERSGHPYARALLDSSRREAESLVEGGDPMNGPYMMIPPEILKAGTTWDRIFLDSVQSRDVQLRFIWETQATYEAVRSRLTNGGNVRLKAIAAGTGLSVIVAYDRLIRDGYDPARIVVRITDRGAGQYRQDQQDPGQTGLDPLAGLQARNSRVESPPESKTSLRRIREAARPSRTSTMWVTAVGILEYLQGFTCGTTERRLKLEQPEEAATAQILAARLDGMTTDSAALIVNTFRPHSSTRILELFGRRFDYRNRENLSALLAPAHFRTPRLVGSGNIYDVEVYEKGAC